MKTLPIICAAMILALAACKEKSGDKNEKTSDVPSTAQQAEQQAAMNPDIAPPTPPAKVEEWAGKWNGPEGTFLDIKKDGEKYKLTIQNLDGPKEFEGKAENGAIWFERDGKNQAIRKGNGGDTGMKWLAEKKDCLIVNPGEGYCRD